MSSRNPMTPWLPASNAASRQTGKSLKQARTPAAPTSLTQTNPAKANPLKKQYAPTAACPIPQRKQWAGDC